MKKQNAIPAGRQGFIQILLLALVLFIIAGVGGYYYFGNRENSNVPLNTSITPEFQADYKASAGSVPLIVKASDLKSASASLDATDLTQIDSELKLLSADSSSF